jgi:hypothetical protein
VKSDVVDTESLALFMDVFGGAVGVAENAQDDGIGQGKRHSPDAGEAPPAAAKNSSRHPYRSEKNPSVGAPAQRAQRVEGECGGGVEASGKRNGREAECKQPCASGASAAPAAGQGRISRKEWGSLESIHAGWGVRDREKPQPADLLPDRGEPDGSSKRSGGGGSSSSSSRSGPANQDGKAVRKEWGSLESIHAGWGSRAVSNATARGKSGHEDVAGSSGGKDEEIEAPISSARGRPQPGRGATEMPGALGAARRPEASAAGARASPAGHDEELAVNGALLPAKGEHRGKPEAPAEIIDLPEDEQVRLAICRYLWVESGFPRVTVN